MLIKLGFLVLAAWIVFVAGGFTNSTTRGFMLIGGCALVFIGVAKARDRAQFGDVRQPGGRGR